MTTTYRILGLDIGKQQDPSASVITEGQMLGRRKVTHAAECQLGSDYTEQAKTWAKMSAYCDMTLADSGGPGWPVIDMMRNLGADVWAVAITGGDKIRFVDSMQSIYVPKKSLVRQASILVEKKMLDLTDGCHRLQGQMTNFINKPTPSGGEAMEAGEGHDDLVMALCISLLGFVILRSKAQ